MKDFDSRLFDPFQIIVYCDAAVLDSVRLFQDASYEQDNNNNIFKISNIQYCRQNKTVTWSLPGLAFQQFSLTNFHHFNYFHWITFPVFSYFP